MGTSERQVHVNPVTGERAVGLTDPREHPDEVLVSHVYVEPGGRVVAAHWHPTVTERFLVMKGQVGFMIDGVERILGPGESATVEPNVIHDWWQVGEATAEVLVEVQPGVRFGEMVGTLFGLARDGKVGPEGLPRPLQLAVTGHEYSDTVIFTKPPALIRKLLVGPLAFIGRRRGLQPMYERYLESSELVAPDPAALAELTPDGRLRPFAEPS